MNKALNFTTTDPNDWATPEGFFEALAQEFGGFDVDVCAYEHNAKCEKYFTPEIDGLAQPWNGSAWCNPPYGHGHIPKWLDKAVSEIRSGRCRQAVFLIPSATDTEWFHEYCVKHGSEIRFVRNRLHFSSPERTGRGSHPSIVVSFSRASIDRGAPKWGTMTATKAIRRGEKKGVRRGVIQRRLAI